MENRLFALLVGINDYPPVSPPIKSLKGCVNDVMQMDQLLQARLKQGGYLSRILTNAEATRQQVIDAFAEHLGQAQAGDEALFYFSGHGSQEYAPQEMWEIEPDHFNETLVCYDSRLPQGLDLADKELAALIRQVAEGGARITVILDCCHSGTATRALEWATERRAETDQRRRPLSSYLAGATRALEPSPAHSPENSPVKQDEGSGWYRLPSGEHILMAACEAREKALEMKFEGIEGGVFSHFLQQALRQWQGSPTYRDLARHVYALTRTLAATQTPQVEVTTSSDLDRRFLEAIWANHPPYFTLSSDQALGWVIDGGAVHGIAAPVADEKTKLLVFPKHIDGEELAKADHALAEAEVVAVQPGISQVEVMPHAAALDRNDSYKAIVIATPQPPIVVYFEGDDPAYASLRAALAVATAGGKPSIFVREGELDNAALVLSRQEGKLVVRRRESDQLLAAAVPVDDASVAVPCLEHAAIWLKLLRVDNPTTSLPANALQTKMRALVDGGVSVDREESSDLPSLHLTQAVDPNATKPQFDLTITNGSEQRLYYVVLSLSEAFNADSLTDPEQGIWLEPKSSATFNITSYIPDELWQLGVQQTTDHLLIIATTQQLDGTQLTLPELSVTSIMRDIDSPFVHLVSTLATRASVLTKKLTQVVDWRVERRSLVISRPQPS